jgi:2-polyprenyl-3-methyl-5-hydroxy-6-metoxy-1,4-benzoquinol methylase
MSGDPIAHRNFDLEFADNDRRYAYDFDDTLRSYMMRTLLPFFSAGSALEIGCFEGQFTQRIMLHFDDVTVVDASARLIELAKVRTAGRPTFICSRIEDVELGRTFDNIFLVHTLEHFDEPVMALSRIRSFLSARGRLFVVVPNANAPSRQIAVKMGLIASNAAITEGEFHHGHRATYAFDTLTRDARESGLTVERQGGVFFKPLSNGQFDRAIANDVVSAEYLEGCYQLGFQYPDLCASIFLICRAS